MTLALTAVLLLLIAVVAASYLVSAVAIARMFLTRPAGRQARR